MSQSILFRLARDSIEEVFQARNSIDKTRLLQEHPLLSAKVPITLKLYRNQELKGTHATEDLQSSLLENIIIAAKKAAFEDTAHAPLSVLEYPYCEIELLLKAPEGDMLERDKAMIEENMVQDLSKMGNFTI